MNKKKFTVVVHDNVTYWDIEAETEGDAIELALDWWSCRQPQYEVIEQKD